MPETSHLIGLLLGTEEDWPRAFETLLERVGPVKSGDGTTHRVTSERITIEPFDLRARPRYELVVDRLAWWYFVPREWLKKIALMDDVYLLNSPFTFQAMEKHAAYCAMLRLGLKVPSTVLIPPKNPPENTRFEYTAAKYNLPFDLGEIAARIGYPLFMKPFDGGQWVGVSRIKDEAGLHGAYDESGQRLMHLQESIEGYDWFARSLSIGAETMIMDFRPDEPMHSRYTVTHDFLTAETGEEVLTISRLINAFFRWEFNSCETLVRGTEAHPIDYANASPDVALTSLHYYWPWAITALLKWSIFCTVTGRSPRGVDLDTRRYFEIGDREDLGYREKLAEYRRLADEYFESERYEQFCATSLAHVDELVLELGGLARLRRAADRHGSYDLSGARARAVRGPLPRACRPLADRARARCADGLSADRPILAADPAATAGPGRLTRPAGSWTPGPAARGEVLTAGPIRPAGAFHSVAPHERSAAYRVGCRRASGRRAPAGGRHRAGRGDLRAPRTRAA